MDWFPELQGLPSTATHIDMQVDEEKMQRKTAVGCQSGYVMCALVNLPSGEQVEVGGGGIGKWRERLF